MQEVQPEARPLAPGTVLLSFEWLARDEHGGAVVGRVVDAIAKAGLGEASVAVHHGKDDELELLDCAVEGGVRLDGELQVLLYSVDTTLWQPSRLQLILPSAFAGRQATRCMQSFEQLASRLDCDFGGICTAHRGSFVPNPSVDPMGLPPPCWVTLLSVREFGPAERYQSCGAAVRTVGETHVLIEAAPPPWDHANARSAEALREFDRSFKALHVMSKSVTANLEALETSEHE